MGGFNLYQYAPNTTGWVDPWGWCSKTLGKNLGNRPANAAAHHLVGDTSKRAKIARDILKKHGIDIDSAVNGVWLPNRNNVDDLAGILHNGKHPNSYFDKVNALIREADDLGGKKAVLEKLNDIRGAPQNAARDTPWKDVLSGL